jgi:hypothetical protein
MVMESREADHISESEQHRTGRALRATLQVVTNCGMPGCGPRYILNRKPKRTTAATPNAKSGPLSV